MRKHNTKFLFLDLFLMILLVLVDQGTKYAAVLKLKDRSSIPLISGVLELKYLENSGAAFGMLQNQKVFFVFVTVIFLCVITCVIFRIPNMPKYNRLHILLTLIASGAIGNLIDRLRLDYVVDFIYIVLINFPIFNVADMYVTFSTAILVIQVLFVYQENDFSFLSPRAERQENSINDSQ